MNRIPHDFEFSPGNSSFCKLDAKVALRRNFYQSVCRYWRIILPARAQIIVLRVGADILAYNVSDLIYWLLEKSVCLYRLHRQTRHATADRCAGICSTGHLVAYSFCLPYRKSRKVPSSFTRSRCICMLLSS